MYGARRGPGEGLLWGGEGRGERGGGGGEEGDNEEGDNEGAGRIRVTEKEGDPGRVFREAEGGGRAGVEEAKREITKREIRRCRKNYEQSIIIL